MPPSEFIPREKVVSLGDLFQQRVKQTPNTIAFTFYDIKQSRWISYTWVDVLQHMIAVRNNLAAEKLKADQPILLVLSNRLEWITIEQAANSLGIPIIALSTTESPKSVCDVAESTNSSIIFLESDSLWQGIKSNKNITDNCVKIISVNQITANHDVTYFSDWLSQFENKKPSQIINVNSDALATIFFSNNKMKGIMHNHKSLLNSAHAFLEKIQYSPSTRILSVTPLGHCVERTSVYYGAMITGANVVFSQAGDVIIDIRSQSPNILITTPYILECAYKNLLLQNKKFSNMIIQYLDYKNGLDKKRIKFLFWPLINRHIAKKTKKEFLGSLDLILSYGTALSKEVLILADLMKLPIREAYSVTEAGGIVALNDLSNNEIFSVGKPLPNIQLDCSTNGQLSIQCNSLMRGYWKNELVTNDVLKNDWLNTHDIAQLENGVLYIRGHKKNLIQMSNGEKISPNMFEHHLEQDTLFEKVMCFGNKRSKLTLICQINPSRWLDFLSRYDIKIKHVKSDFTPKMLSMLYIRINTFLKSLPGHRHIDYILPTLNEWTIDNGLLNDQGRINRLSLEQHYEKEITLLYKNEF